MPTWIEVIIKVMENHGGQASLVQIYKEAEDIKGGPLPLAYKETIGKNIYSNTSNNPNYTGKDLFKRVSNGVWALQDSLTVPQASQLIRVKYPPSIKNTSLLDSREDVANALRTIKQYREYQHPGSPSWLDYIKELIHVLGFSTKEQDPRLYTLSLMGSETPKVALLFIQAGEEIEGIVPGFTWKTHLRYAANNFHVRWGILTDGLHLDVFNFDNNGVNKIVSWPNFDEIISNEDLSSFASVYNVFLEFKKTSRISRRKAWKEEFSQNKAGVTEHQSQLVEFWNQLIQKAMASSSIQITDHPRPRYFLHAKAGRRGLVYSFVIPKVKAQIELYIDIGIERRNKEIFEHFFQNKSEIEAAFGNHLEWQLLPGKRASRIRYIVSKYGLDKNEFWGQLQDQLISSMVDLQKALQPYIYTIS